MILELSRGEESIVAQELSWVKSILLAVCSVIKVPHLWSGMDTGLRRPDFWKTHTLLEVLGSTAFMEDALLTALHPEEAPLAVMLQGWAWFLLGIRRGPGGSSPAPSGHS